MERVFLGLSLNQWLDFGIVIFIFLFVLILGRPIIGFIIEITLGRIRPLKTRTPSADRSAEGVLVFKEYSFVPPAQRGS